MTVALRRGHQMNLLNGQPCLVQTESEGDLVWLGQFASQLRLRTADRLQRPIG